MERLNKNSLSFPARFFTQAFAALGLVVALVGCKGNDGGGYAPAPIYGNGCQNCTSISSPVLLTTFNSKSSDGKVALMNMQVYAQSTNITPMASGNNYKGYRGPIAAQGQLVVTEARTDVDPVTGRALTACVLPAGTFPIQTYTVGSMEYDGLNVTFPALLTTVNAIEVSVESPSPMGFLDGGQTLWAKVAVTRINGVRCSENFFGIFK